MQQCARMMTNMAQRKSFCVMSQTAARRSGLKGDRQRRARPPENRHRKLLGSMAMKVAALSA